MVKNLQSHNPNLLPEDDGLPMREFGAWVIEKLFYVRRYIELFTTSMYDKPWRSRRYFDLYSGSGKCFVKDVNKVYLGSPLISLTIKYPFTDYIFIDKSEENIGALRGRCASYNKGVKIIYKVGDSNSLINDIVQDIEQGDNIFQRGKWSSLNLAFLDPDGLELEWITIQTLARITKMDLIIHYSQSGLTRNLERCLADNNETIIDRFFGDRKWRQIFERERLKSSNITSTHGALIDYYRSKLVSLGYVDVRTLDDDYDPLVRSSQTKAPLYRLLFASKHELGHNFWKKVTQKDAYGQASVTVVQSDAIR